MIVRYKTNLFKNIFSLLILFSATQVFAKGINIAIYVPGIVSGSPTYEMLVNGTKEGVAKYKATNTKANIKITIIEVGTNQSEWAQKMMAIVASKKYDLIVSSNPALPDIIEPIAKKFPKQKFIVLDAYKADNKSIKTVRYNQHEQGYLTGYIAGLVTTSKSAKMKFANPQKKIALIAAQEYPVMNNIILPSFTEGAKAADSEIEVEFRIVGNWYDATKAATLSQSLYASGVDVILPICGGASQGVISEAKNLGFYITWFDENGFSKAPENIISSCVIKQDKVAEKVILEYLEGKTQFGEATTVGINDGFVEFIVADPIYKDIIDEEIAKQVSQKISEIKNGKLVLSSK